MSTGMRSGARRYSMQEHGQSDMRGGLQGNYVLKRGQGHFWGPSFKGGATTIRIFPVRSPTDPTVWDPYRFSAQPGAFGDWLRRYPAVRSFGDPGVTFITHDPTDKSIDPQMSPAWVLYRAVDQAVAAGQDPGWGYLLRGSSGRSAQLSKPSEIYLTQAAIMAHKGKPYPVPKGGGGPDDELVVFGIPPSGGLAMIDLLNEINPEFQGMDNDFVNKMKYGDPISLAHGKYITFYSLEMGDPRQQGVYNNQQPQSAFGASAPQERGRGKMEEKGYGCYIEDTFNGQPAQLSFLEELISNRVRPWDEILNFPTYEEQAALLAGKFPPQVIAYAWRDHPHWIPEDVRRNAVAAHSVAVGAAGGFLPQQPPPSGFGGAAPGGFGGAPAGGFGGAPAGGFSGAAPQSPAGYAAPPQQPVGGFGGAPAGGFGGAMPPGANAAPPQQPPASFGGWGAAPPPPTGGVGQPPTQDNALPQGAIPPSPPFDPSHAAPPQPLAQQQPPAPPQTPPQQPPAGDGMSTLERARARAGRRP